MNDRRSLLDGIEPKPVSGDAQTNAEERDFVYRKDASNAEDAGVRMQVSTRIRGDYARALKRASLQRQLDGITPYTLQEMLEEAVKAWLKKQRYL